MTATALTRVTIDRLGHRGEGVAGAGASRVHVPYALPGETVSVDREGERGTLVGIYTPSPDRIEAICPYFTTCGGCAVQTLSSSSYATWKRGLLVEALARAGIAADVAPLADAHGAGRRRATFHARVDPDGRTRVGFMQARSHAIVPIEACPVLDPILDGALRAARAVADALALSNKPLDIVATGTSSGLDLDLRGHGPLSEGARKRLVAVALGQGLARLSNHGVIVVERVKPRLRVGTAMVEPPPGVFLQATEAGETMLGARVVAALAGARRVADLFSGLGTFALPLARTADIQAFDSDNQALAALERASRTTPCLRPVATETRDLFARPLATGELDRFDAVVVDPPRAGAETQMRAIAASRIGRVVSVACDVQTFARDVAILLAHGFNLDRVEPLDQFRYSPHVEVFASLRREPTRKKRRLLG